MMGRQPGGQERLFCGFCRLGLEDKVPDHSGFSKNLECRGCPATSMCGPNTPQRKVTRKDRKKVEMLLAHLKRILQPDRL